MSAWAARRVAAPSDAERIAELAERSLVLEIDTYPKPGLVSHVDTGSHTDMDAATFTRSAAVLRPYFAELADAGARDADMAVLRKIGLRAEHAMLAATGGVNTHRGAIFGLGLLCAAAGRRMVRGTPAAARTMTLGAWVAQRWGTEILGGPRLPDSHGERASRRYGVGGARREAAGGFATVYGVGLPALRRAKRCMPDDPEAARVEACFALIAALDDTNLLHRGGQDGLDFARATARAFVARGGIRARDWRARADAAHRAFVVRRLSPGGAADLLAMSVFVDALEAPEAGESGEDGR
ncbi:triphosphoribosyl-dephospho-CoA synthase MdcB [Burkholderia sp. Nafp2/4-1b]|uniref:triphosphoribosyl-dephospho-CoA synthase MdcB n=1 Tax=Burkholderia sp. Nafp2/4-1b TaxID=2116686 RepID=UPI000EF939EF|nr:triphosphoribosyl-dephospho-CoA synthase MdcB [Burkholderia sp. Nafp2/4-1b]RKU02156.1 triphosphoribosyl-dephospho-CoA synthase MdcB [Burkholderia sp. Nafp2/4-1b]